VDERFHRYLRAKRSVDDRSLDRGLVSTLREKLVETARQDEPLRVLDVGAGLGAMVERLLEWEVLPPGRIEYTAVDVDESTVAAIPDHLLAWASDHGYAASRDGGTLELAGEHRTVSVRPVAAEGTSFVSRTDREWDLLVGAALLDIVALDHLPVLLSGLAPGGYWYFPITFDGVTRFLPAHPADEAIERHYHRHMDQKDGGDSRAGTHTLDRLESMTAVTVVGVAGSDWIVRPEDGAYPGDEAFFLRYIVETVESAIGDLETRDLPAETLASWLSTRRSQIEAGELTYLTHQLDLLGRYRVA